MKTLDLVSWFLIGFLLGVFGFIATGHAFEVPADAVIKVYDSKGNLIGNMNRKEYKVVKVESQKTFTEKQVLDIKIKSLGAGINWGRGIGNNEAKNRLYYSAIITGGVGRDGLKASHDNGYVVEEKVAPVGQSTLCATQDMAGICGTAATNRFYGMGIKFDFN